MTSTRKKGAPCGLSLTLITLTQAPPRKLSFPLRFPWQCFRNFSVKMDSKTQLAVVHIKGIYVVLVLTQVCNKQLCNSQVCVITVSLK